MNANVRTLSDGRIGLVTLSGEIDFSVIPALREAFGEGLSGKPTCLLIDLADVSFIASDGLGALIETQRAATAAGTRIHLVHPQPHILGLLRKTQLTRLFQIHESVDDAVKGC